MTSVRFKVAAAATVLQESEALSSDWYMFFWLAGLAEKQGEIKEVTQYSMRFGVQTPEGFYWPLRMSAPIMRETIKRLKQYGVAEHEGGVIKSTTIKLKEIKDGRKAGGALSGGNQEPQAANGSTG